MTSVILGGARFSMRITMRIYDLYDWPAGIDYGDFTVSVFSSLMHTLHLIGEAREFANFGKGTIEDSWRKGDRLTP